MVALLWDAGLVNDAVQLEEMWGSLGLSHSFSLFCSYPARSVTGDGHHLRFSYATAEARIEQGLQRLGDWIRTAKR